jgi:hypothetical protein
MRIESSVVNNKMKVFFHMKKASNWGGKREGAGRQSEGKAAFNVTLNAKNVAKARKRESNLSGLLDRLLAAWLG